MKNGFITKVNAGWYQVFSEGAFYNCRARGKFRILEETPVCGDYVNFDEENLYLMELLPRKNHFIRPPIANIDQVVILSSVVNPTISLTLINRFVTLSEIANIKPLIVLTKIDLVQDPKEYQSIIDVFRNMQYDVFLLATKKGIGVEELSEKLKGKKSVFTGQSGVGKSTLLNQLIPHLNQKTEEISRVLGRGKHITRVVEFIPYYDGWIADTPGFSLIEFDIKPIDFAVSFPGFEHYYQQCRFRNCMHDTERGCAVKQAVHEKIISQEHYDIYLSMLSEMKNRKEKF